MDDRVGFGFRPTDDELVGYYLQYKTQGMMTWLVEEAIKEINVYSFDPWDLRFQSKVKSRYPVWYFFNKFGNGDRQSRRTTSGFWKITGDPVDIKDRWGIWSGTREKIGHKRVLVFHKGKNAKMGKTDWVMHEYHSTISPENQTHVICRVEYKGDDISFLSDYATEPTPVFVHYPTNSAGSVVDQSVQRNLESSNNLYAYDSTTQMDQSVGNWEFFNNLSKYDSEIQHFASNFNTQEQASYFASNDNQRQKLWDYDIENIPHFSLDEVQGHSNTYMENYNEYQPKNPVTKVFNDYGSDSDNESTLFGDTSSSVDSVGDPSEFCSTPNPPLNSIDQNPTTELQITYRPPEVKMELQGEEKVKNEWEMKMAEDSCIKKTPTTSRSRQNWSLIEDEKIEKKTHKTPKWIYLRNIIVAVLLLLCFFSWSLQFLV